MSADQFSLWLHNRKLFNELGEDTLKLKQSEIISFFGGFREVINLCLKQQFNLHLPQQQQLFKLLISFKTEQNKKLSISEHIQANKNKNNNQQQTEIESELKPTQTPLSLLDLYDICVSNIFTFLNKTDHISSQKSCKSLTIIGRKKESFRINPTDHSYIDFGSYLQIEHKLPYIINHIDSDVASDCHKALNALKTLPWNKKNDNKMINSGIIQKLFALCMNNNIEIDEHDPICITVYVMSYIHIHTYSQRSEQAFIEHGMFEIIKRFIANTSIKDTDFVTLCLGILHDFVIGDKRRVMLLNEMNFLPLLVSNLTSMICDTSEDTDILDILYHLISAINFDWEDVDNNIVLQTLVNYSLLECAESIRENIINIYEDTEWLSNNCIIKIFDIINIASNITIKFDINDENAMSLILFLLERTEDTDSILMNVVEKWLNIDIKLLFDADICDFVVSHAQKKDTKVIYELYLRLLASINHASIRRHSYTKYDCLNQIREFLVAEPHFWELDVFNANAFLLWLKPLHEPCVQSIDFYYELFSFLQQLKKKFNEIIDYIRHFKLNETFINLLNEGIDSKDSSKNCKIVNYKYNYIQLSLWEICGDDMRLFRFVRCDEYKIFKQVIKECYLSTDIVAMKCCLIISKLDDIDRYTLIRYGIIYAFQDFISYFYNKAQYAQIVCEVMESLNQFVDYGVQHLPNLGGMEANILADPSVPLKVKKTVKKCNGIWK